MAATKLPTKTKTTALVPSAQVQAAYDVKLTPEAVEQLSKIKEYGDYANDQAEHASKVTIKDDATDAHAAELTVNLTKARKGLEDLQKFFTQPLEARKKLVIAVFKKLLESPTAQEERLRREAEGYFMRKENAKRELEAKQKADKEVADRKAAQLGRSAPKVIAAPPQPETVRTVASDNGSRGMSLVWGWDEVDIKLVPEQYIIKTVNKKFVDAAIEGGMRTIPGLLISERPRSVVR